MNNLPLLKAPTLHELIKEAIEKERATHERYYSKNRDKLITKYYKQRNLKLKKEYETLKTLCKDENISKIIKKWYLAQTRTKKK